MTPTVEAAVKELVRRRAYWHRNRSQQHPMRGFIKYEQARFALAAALGMAWITYDQADVIADDYEQRTDPPATAQHLRVAR